MEKTSVEKNNLGLLSRVLGLAVPYKALLIFNIIVGLIVAPIAVLRPRLISVMVDDYIMNTDLPGLYRTALLFVLVVVVTVVLRYLFTYYTSVLGQSVIRDLRIQTFQHIQSLKLRFFDQTPIGTATTRTINDIEAINQIFTQGLMTMMADILTIFAVIGIMFYTNWRLTLVCLAMVPFLLIATYIFKEKVKAAYQKVRSHISEMNAFLQERITGMRIVQIFNAEEQEMEKFKTINRKYTQANIDSIFYYAVFYPVVEIIQYGTLALIVWFGSEWFIGDKVTFGALVSFPLYVNMLFRPIRMLADKFNVLQMGLIAAERVFKIIDDKSVIPNIGYLKPASLQGHVEFKNVGFAYDEENFVINDLSFEVQPGETLAVVGSTGSGKTTIINILNRFYEIQKGDICIDGESIKKYDLLQLRSKMALVMQDVFLFTGSVLENITLKDEHITKEEVVKAAKQIGAHDFILKMPGDYDYVVMERGANLSMGQRQLISFVRALVFDPDILILDEATSSIDTETEAIIQYAIEKLIAKRTSFIIAHRLSTIRHADKILVMEHGQMAEFGSPETLLKDPNGTYRALFDMQYAGAPELVLDR